MRKNDLTSLLSHLVASVRDPIIETLFEYVCIEINGISEIPEFKTHLNAP